MPFQNERQQEYNMCCHRDIRIADGDSRHDNTYALFGDAHIWRRAELFACFWESVLVLSMIPLNELPLGIHLQLNKYPHIGGVYSVIREQFP